MNEKLLNVLESREEGGARSKVEKRLKLYKIDKRGVDLSD